MEQSIVDKIVGFINEIGIPCIKQAADGDCFLPGIFIRRGCIFYDPEQMKYPGDLLHEAGHIAVLKPKDRCEAEGPDKMFGDISRQGAEMAAIAWSWAALKHLKLEPSVVFHEHGYRDGSANLIQNFSEGRYIGVPMLQWFGMTEGDVRAHLMAQSLYPGMRYWLRQ